MKFSNFRIAQKLLLAFGAIILVITISSVVLYSQIRGLVRGQSTELGVAKTAVDWLDQAGMRTVASATAAVRKFILTALDADKAGCCQGPWPTEATDLASIRTDA